MKIVYVVEVEVPDDFGQASSIDSSARAVMDAVRAQTNIPTRAWVSVADVAEAVVAAVGGT